MWVCYTLYMNKKLLPIIIIGVIAVLIFGVFALTRMGSSGTSGGSTKIGKYDTLFPMPSTVQNFTKGESEGQINFSTNLTIKQAEEFYRTELTKMGLTERTINTATTDTTFSMVYDGSENGKQVVVQGVDLGGKTNVNIRFEAL
ncbi:MAG: hypothetical protein ACD_22C00253G0008 [uncultured bacterium]|nr:MAG: hypothetical protein ACD_22C00253G0008 [uncultured bacterium]